VLKFKDYSIDSDGEENEPVEWKWAAVVSITMSRVGAEQMC
jgi:hypothetical protein